MKIAFPMMGNYYIPATYFLEKVIDKEIIKPPQISLKTISLGNSYSPNFVCTPFKYTLGTMIECLDMGADTLIQMGGGCRYGYYSELQEEILKKLGYNFKLYTLVSKGHTDLKRIYNTLKEINPNIRLRKVIYYGIITSLMIRSMDKIDDYIRENIGFEVEKDSFIKLRDKMYQEMIKVKTITGINIIYRKYKKRFRKIKINKPDDCLKIGLIGELYTIMEPFSNFDLEKMLADYHISIKRYTNVWYLIYKKMFVIKKYIKKTPYIKYKMGADASDNIYRVLYLCKNKYDGIIHIKSSFCTPEIGAMSIINKICKEYNVPVIFFSFDSNTSLVGVRTRVEAFYDMIKMRKNVNFDD